MKKFMIIFWISAIIVLVFPDKIISQERVVQGVVTFFDSIPLINASVRVKSSNETVLTDSTGHFSVTTEPKDRLFINAEGFYRERVSLNEKTKYALINLRLRQGKKSIDRAVGYGHVKDKELMYSVSTMNSDDLDFSIYNNIYDIIQSRFTGVTIRGSEIIIRGDPNLGHSSSAALLVVDGIVVSESVFSSLQPADIKTINVLKDSSAASFGSRGANGVVLVETRK